MSRMGRALLLAGGCLVALAARAANVDAWIEALATTEIVCDAQLVSATRLREQNVRAILVAVQRQCPELQRLALVGQPAELLVAREDLGPPPGRRLIAADVLKAVLPGRVRIELTDSELRLVQTHGAEDDREAFARKAVEDRLWAATAAGPADRTVVDLACAELRRARTLASGGVGYAGSLRPALPAWRIVVESTDAEARLREIAESGTLAGRLYAFAGLVARGVRPADLPTRSLPGNVMTMAGCLGREMDPEVFFRTEILTGRFGRELVETLNRARDRARPVGRPKGGFLQAMAQDAAAVRPVPVGRALFDEIERPAFSSWSPSRM